MSSSVFSRYSDDRTLRRSSGFPELDCIHLPGVYVQRMIVGAPYDKMIEFRTVRERESA